MASYGASFENVSLESLSLSISQTYFETQNQALASYLGPIA